MKKGKLNKAKLKALKKIFKSTYGLQHEICGKRKFMTAKVRFEDHEDYMMRVSALLETAVLALDGNGEFFSDMLSNKSKPDSIRLTIEMAIELLPHDDLFKLRKLLAIIEDDFDNHYYPEELKQKLKDKKDKKDEKEKIN